MCNSHTSNCLSIYRNRHPWFLFLAITLLFTNCKADSRKGSTPLVIDASADTAVGKMVAPASGSLRIMSYNVLKFGDGCQGSPKDLHPYFRKILKYANADIVGLVKVAAIPVDGIEGKAPKDFDKEIRDEDFNASFPDRYSVCPFSNHADANNVNLLFYDKHKMGFAGMETLVSNETDFNLFRLYLISSIQNGSKDTSFLYIILNHTESGDKSDLRDVQLHQILSRLQQGFKEMPAVICMGDFNLRNTDEAGYHSLILGKSAFHFDDPPFALDHWLKYPADWENHPELYQRFLTTSTRKKEGEPNNCGTAGGAKFWFDHILISTFISKGSGIFSYHPGSFRVLGNDGKRLGLSVNAPKHPNSAISEELAEALFQFSNKYPVMLDLDIRH